MSATSSFSGDSVFFLWRDLEDFLDEDLLLRSFFGDVDDWCFDLDFFREGDFFLDFELLRWRRLLVFDDSSSDTYWSSLRGNGGSKF